ncbi:class II aldolase/adducin family protein, partial [Mycobacterium sp. UM_CSW]|uniref:class II aldolase/adducin family protein n=1 Tax=Mycobacterium sp. UM_CSW TaxID=1370119 RepID=UPI0019553076
MTKTFSGGCAGSAQLVGTLLTALARESTLKQAEPTRRMGHRNTSMIRVPSKSVLQQAGSNETGFGECEMTTAHEVQIHAQRIIEANKHLLVSGVLSHSGLANLSARLDADRFLLTTTGYVRELRPDQLATVGLDGEVLDGELAPENAEIIAMHSVVYNARIDVGSVIHTHSPAATAFALAHRPLPCR